MTMSGDSPARCTAFAGAHLIARGSLAEVAAVVRARDAAAGPILIFDDATGRVVDLDPRETFETATAPTDGLPRGRGRPKLGVVAREVTLLPRHWDWLAVQPGGASATLRRLIDEARKRDAGAGEARAARDAAYRFMAAMAGDLPGFEEATRALFADDRPGFARQSAGWPLDIRAHTEALAWGEA
jgi:hypothetical protein